MNEFYKRTQPQYKFGPWYDHYVKASGVCHPDFDTTIVSGNDARGVKVCTRRVPYKIPTTMSPPNIFFQNKNILEHNGTGLYNASRKIVYF